MADLITIKEPSNPHECFTVEILPEGSGESCANYYRTMRGARIAVTLQMRRSGNVYRYIEPEEMERETQSRQNVMIKHGGRP